MKKKIHTSAIILAAGSGSRYDKEYLKQYQYIDDKTVIYHSIKPFINTQIDIICVVINKNHHVYAKNALKDLKISKLINGGKTRQESVLNALIELKKYKPNKKTWRLTKDISPFVLSYNPKVIARFEPR